MESAGPGRWFIYTQRPLSKQVRGPGSREPTANLNVELLIRATLGKIIL